MEHISHLVCLGILIFSFGFCVGASVWEKCLQKYKDLYQSAYRECERAQGLCLQYQEQLQRMIENSIASKPPKPESNTWLSFTGCKTMEELKQWEWAHQAEIREWSERAMESLYRGIGNVTIELTSEVESKAQNVQGSDTTDGDSKERVK